MSIMFFNTGIAKTLRSDCTTISLHKRKTEKRIKYIVGAGKTCCPGSHTACAEIALRL
ncbi:hypothetical protein [Ruminococcus sp.]|uniref:hypothetical protein n=1 Tax=Ruminococcus sp. TaxID=41978 RepID=UPI0025EE271C|nr:hypothetical protein [Ruminococcus sp.]